MAFCGDGSHFGQTFSWPVIDAEPFNVRAPRLLARGALASVCTPIAWMPKSCALRYAGMPIARYPLPSGLVEGSIVIENICRPPPKFWTIAYVVVPATVKPAAMLLGADVPAIALALSCRFTAMAMPLADTERSCSSSSGFFSAQAHEAAKTRPQAMMGR
jgi:hypothetical protein